MSAAVHPSPTRSASAAGSSPWSQHDKHAFLLTSAGKPVWSLHGSADALASLAPIVQAVLARAEDGGEPLTQLALSDGTLLLVASRGPLHGCVLSRTGECAHALAQQLRLLHAYLLFATLPGGSLLAILAARPGADVRPQCAGVERGMQAAAALGARAPSVWADAYPMAGGGEWPAGLRARAAGALGSGGRALAAGGAAGAQLLYALLLSVGGGEGAEPPALVAWAQQPELPLRPLDWHCLVAYCSARAGGVVGEAWVPCGFPGLSVSGTVQLFLRRLGGEAGAPAGLREAQSPLDDAAEQGEAVGSSAGAEEGEAGGSPGGSPGGSAGEGSSTDQRPVQPQQPRSLVLALVLVGASPSAAAARAAALARSLADVGAVPRTLCAPPPTFAAVMEPMHAALGLPFPTPASPSSTSATTLCLLHYGYLWKPARQWAGCGVWPEGMGERARRHDPGGGTKHAGLCPHALLQL